MLIKIKHIAAVAIAFAICSASNSAKAQANWADAALKRYAIWAAPGHLPTSNAQAYKGQMRVELGCNSYIKSGLKPDANADSHGWFNPHFMTMKLKLVPNLHLGLSYSPSNRLTLGASGLLAANVFACNSERYRTAIELDSRFFGMDLSASYHDWFGGRFAYEVRYNFGFSHMRSQVDALKKRWESFGSSVHLAGIILEAAIEADRDLAASNGDDCIKGWALRHGLMGGVSAFNDTRSLQATFQLQADYVRFINRTYSYLQREDYSPVQVQYDMFQRYSQDRGFAQFTPALLFAWHAKYLFSVQFHVGVPMSVLNGKVYAPCPSLGLQFSFRIKKMRRTPVDTAKVIEKVINTAGSIIEEYVLKDEE